ncbi:MAG: ankyrin repeat domain-containing protein [Sphaerochaetaceae bacterium]|mgnify:FL=1|jgi:ankyrin repeat protein|nr:ankyrin repeat domain-containing protein [Sphaerochaetaceae bacterium]NLO61674.1 ankyrin repeat domain-containing protein [Spirochaetales bacterium]MDD2405525.1 ankyrin repeat domain-containing protein [Sphaerochaetaceae bacterium]MDD3670471.1 ankyrin repeat domain-containing protein [Sphaerochaetaceae bacterium]MDD4258530.1 ankyrin repeat domain-containing protein [Sphaerochaetaceae bacterium]
MDSEKLQEKLLAAADSAKSAAEIHSLLKKGADVHCKDTFGLTPIMRAALFNSSADVINALVEAGADVFEREPQYKSTALQLAANHNPNPKVIEALVTAGADVHDVNYLGETALVMAVNSGNVTSVISALIKAGSDVNARDYQDRSALDYARMSRRRYVVKILKDAGAK